MKLRNQDIWYAYIRLTELAEMQFPFEVSLQISKTLQSLQNPYQEIEQKRLKLARQFGENKRGEFALAFGKLLIEYYNQDIEFEKIKLPTKITTKCEYCGKETETVFLINSAGLAPLIDNFNEDDMEDKQKTIYFSLPVQIFISNDIKKPIFETTENLSSYLEKLKAIWRLWKIYKSLSKLPEPTKENTWHPNTHNLIDLRDWLLERCFLDELRIRFIHRVINFIIQLFDYDPPWRWIMDSLREKAFEMKWVKRGYQDNRTYKWWKENYGVKR